MKYLWMAVTADKYEFPIYIEKTARELGEKLGISRDNVNMAVKRENSGKYSGRKLVKVLLEDENE